ncbi:hypothetical protein L484_001402 [Morus notabilis]|uniref:Uncharacterized protein n=1 Tax=Morus notabilis TaxID=981085 RepID=W9QHI3_9ROSA|nr:hypothetical protein L484_001402 [Morus notabilis]
MPKFISTGNPNANLRVDAEHSMRLISGFGQESSQSISFQWTSSTPLFAARVRSYFGRLNSQAVGQIGLPKFATQTSRLWLGSEQPSASSTLKPQALDNSRVATRRTDSSSSELLEWPG